MKHDHQAKDRPDAKSEEMPVDRNPQGGNWKPIGDLARRLVEKAVSGE
jgi:hypothetical protein